MKQKSATRQTDVDDVTENVVSRVNVAEELNAAGPVDQTSANVH